MAATRLRRVGGRDDDLLHHVPLHLVRHGVRRHAIVAGGARNPDPSAGDVDDAVENAATVAALLEAEKADKEKKLESFRRDTRRRVAARVAAERGDDARHTADIALAVIRRDIPADARERRREDARGSTPSGIDAVARLFKNGKERHRSGSRTSSTPKFGPTGAVEVSVLIAAVAAAPRVREGRGREDAPPGGRGARAVQRAGIGEGRA